MAALLRILLHLLAVTTCVIGQWPLGRDFYTGMYDLQRSMDNMANNMQYMQYNMQYNMAVNMQAMQDQMRRQSQYALDNSMRNIDQVRTYGQGGRTFTTADGGTGFIYNSPDGSYNSFSFSSAPSSSGYVYHSGPRGSYYRQW